MSKTILRSNETMTKKERYFMTAAPNIGKVSDNVGSTFDVVAWCIYDDEKDAGDTATITAFLTPEGEAYATNSATFRRSFEDIIETFEGEDIRIHIISDTSKSGRTFVDCVYAG